MKNYCPECKSEKIMLGTAPARRKREGWNPEDQKNIEKNKNFCLECKNEWSDPAI